MQKGGRIEIFSYNKREKEGCCLLYQKMKIHFPQLFMLTLAGIINAIGVTIFLSPVKLYDSGISGTSMLFSQLTPETLSLSFFLLVLNIPLFLYAILKKRIICNRIDV